MKENDKLVYCGETNEHYTKNKIYCIRKVEVHNGEWLKFKYYEVINDLGGYSWQLYGTENKFAYLKEYRKLKIQKINGNRCKV